MNSVVLKGKLGAGFNDDRYMLPKGGNPGDILVETETGSEWRKNQRVIIHGYFWTYEGAVYIGMNEDPYQLDNAGNLKDVLLHVDSQGKVLLFVYSAYLFYTIIPKSEDESGVSKLLILIASEPAYPNPLWNCPYKYVCRLSDFTLGG